MADEAGNVLITVVLVSMIIGALTAAALRTGEHAQTSAASDRNHHAALGIAEGGVHEAVASINTAPGTYMDCAGDPLPNHCAFEDTTPDGDYALEVRRIPNGFVLDSGADAGGEVLGRSRRIRVTLLPPRHLEEQYALFSFTSIDVKNNDVITGDAWANDSVIVRAGTNLSGSVTAATSWLVLEQGAGIGDFAWTGGFNASTDRAIDMANASSIGSWAKASVTSPSDPDTCEDEVGQQAHYNIAMHGSASIGDEVTTWGQISPDNGNHGSALVGECTAAPAAQPMPVYTFNPANYPPLQDPCPPNGMFCQFSSVAGFQTWLNTSGSRAGLEGVFKIDESAPSQSCSNPINNPESCRRVDLSGVSIAGDVTIVTNAPVYTDDMTDAVAAGELPLLFIVSHYAPPTGTACSVNADGSECAIHAKNGYEFDDECTTAALLYADEGPVALKNNGQSCGQIISDGILIKNNLLFQYDARVDRAIGFGDVTYEIARWEECPVSGCA